MSKIHWTPLAIAKTAASFLAPVAGSRVLDIGSGIGKFCISAAHFFPDSEFHGVEQRKDLVDLAIAAQQRSEMTNVQFLHGNFTELSLEHYDSIYFYNAFAENMIDVARIDESIDYSPGLYTYYSNYLCKGLENMASGTRLVTFHGYGHEIPMGYKMVEQDIQKNLKMWIKI
ncbi:methyltransferase domain-containing protein [Pedobacter suwonensis]|uniref:methyltransferase domain-containing protein n=1 Tax=Pedobacter suwonensis TaxID=332999 RepID=UPI00368DC5B4